MFLSRAAAPLPAPALVLSVSWLSAPPANPACVFLNLRRQQHSNINPLRGETVHPNHKSTSSPSLAGWGI